MSDEEKPRLEIDWIKAFAGALAAVSSAVLLSTLGAAGTLIGAAIGSLALTITSAFYQQGLARSRQKLAEAQNAALQKVNRAQTDVRRADISADDTLVEEHLESAQDHLAEASAELREDPEQDADPTWRQRLITLPWKKIAVVAVGLFLTAMLIITAFELLTGRTVSSITGGSDSKGGTSISRITGGDTGNDTDKDKDNKNNDRDDNGPSGQTSPTDRSSDESTDEPTVSETETSGPTEEPTDTPTESPTEEPTQEPTQAPSQAPSQQVAPSAEVS